MKRRAEYEGNLFGDLKPEKKKRSNSKGWSTNGSMTKKIKKEADVLRDGRRRAITPEWYGYDHRGEGYYKEPDVWETTRGQYWKPFKSLDKEAWQLHYINKILLEKLYITDEELMHFISQIDLNVLDVIQLANLRDVICNKLKIVPAKSTLTPSIEWSPSETAIHEQDKKQAVQPDFDKPVGVIGFETSPSAQVQLTCTDIVLKSQVEEKKQGGHEWSSSETSKQEQVEKQAVPSDFDKSAEVMCLETSPLARLASTCPDIVLTSPIKEEKQGGQPAVKLELQTLAEKLRLELELELELSRKAEIKENFSNGKSDSAELSHKTRIPVLDIIVTIVVLFLAYFYYNF